MRRKRKRFFGLSVWVGLLWGISFFSCHTQPTNQEIMGYNADDLVVRTADGCLLLVPFENGTFAGPQARKKIGHKWNLTNYLLLDGPAPVGNCEAQLVLPWLFNQ